MKKFFKIWLIIAMTLTICYQNGFSSYATDAQTGKIQSLKVEGEKIKVEVNSSDVSNYTFALAESGGLEPTQYVTLDSITVESQKVYTLYKKASDGSIETYDFNTVAPSTFTITKNYVANGTKYEKVTIDVKFDNANDSDPIHFNIMKDTDLIETVTTTSFDITRADANRIVAEDQFGNQTELAIDVSGIGTTVITPQVTLSPTTGFSKQIVATIKQVTDCQYGCILKENKDSIVFGNQNEFTITSNGTYIFAIKSSKDIITETEVTIDRIDTEKPTFSTPSYSLENGYITIHSEDSDSSGLQYKMDDGSYQNENKFVFQENTTHRFQVKDSAGNESDVLTVDKKLPEINSVKLEAIGDTVNTYFKEANIIIKASDDISSPEKLVYAVSTSSSVPGNERFKNGTSVDGGVYSLGKLPENQGEVYVFVKDEAGNVAMKQISSTDLDKIDTNGPKIENINVESQTIAGQSFASKDDGFTMEITAKDDKSGLHADAYAVVPLPDGQDQQTVANSISATSYDSKNTFTFKTGGDFEESGVYLIVVRDGLGNISYTTQEITFDESAPTVETASLDLTSTIMDSIKNMLGFAPFSGLKLTVTVPIKDSQIGVDKDNTKLIVENDNGKIIGEYAVFSNEGDLYSFEVPLTNQIFKMYVSTQDKAQNQLDKVEILHISNEGNNIGLPILLDNTKPVITNENINVDVKNINGKDWIKEDAIITYLVSDIVENGTCSGIQTIQTTVNGNTKDITVDQSAKVDSQTITINTSDYTANTNGLFDISIVVKDNAGNESEAFQRSIYLDKTAPVIDVANLSLTPTLDNKTIKSLGYVPFQANTILVSVPVTDHLSGINKDKTQFIVKNGNKIVKTYPVNSMKDGHYLFSIDVKDTLLTMYLSTEDLLANSVVEQRVSYIINSETLNLPILLDTNKPTVSHENINTSITQLDGKDWIGENTTISYLISDVVKNTTCSGLKSIDLTINDKKQTVQIDSTQKIENQTIIIDTKDYNPHNDGSMIIKMKIVDNAGNEQSFSRVIYVDLDKPQLSLSYDNNAADKDYTNVYKADRVATLTIKEINFDESLIDIQVSEDGNIKTIKPHWDLISGTAQTTSAIYQAKISFNKNVDYKFNVNGKDKVGHSINNPINDTFTIDKIKPLLTVSYDNNKSTNGNYFAANRTATIRIQEHNFDSRRFHLMTSSTDNGTNINFPSLSSWRNDGDTHIATITFNRDGYYKLDCEYQDKAGNSISDFAMQDFYIDKTVPEIQFSGVEKNSTNTGSVTPVVYVSDTNYDQNAVSIQYSGAHRGNLKFDGSRGTKGNGEVFTFANLAKKKINDDIYSIHVTVKDKAGNSSEADITYSVNRFGSTYQMSEELNKILNTKYVTNCGDVVFSEINVNTIQNVVVKLSINGQIKELKQGEDYTINRTNEKSWNRYIYTIKGSLFDSDGIYQIIVNSVDSAGNVNENIIESKKANIVFTVDKTAPTIAISGIENNGIYNTSHKSVQILSEDNVELSKLEVYLNGKLLSIEDNQFTPTIEINESNAVQTLQAIAYDKAGNKYETDIYKLTVSTNFFVRLYMNKPMFYTSIGAMFVAVGGIITVIFKKKPKIGKKKSKD